MPLLWSATDYDCCDNLSNISAVPSCVKKKMGSQAPLVQTHMHSTHWQITANPENQNPYTLGLGHPEDCTWLAKLTNAQQGSWSLLCSAFKACWLTAMAALSISQLLQYKTRKTIWLHCNSSSYISFCSKQPQYPNTVESRSYKHCLCKCARFPDRTIVYMVHNFVCSEHTAPLRMIQPCKPRPHPWALSEARTSQTPRPLAALHTHKEQRAAARSLHITNIAITSLTVCTASSEHGCK